MWLRDDVDLSAFKPKEAVQGIYKITGEMDVKIPTQDRFFAALHTGEYSGTKWQPFAQAKYYHVSHWWGLYREFCAENDRNGLQRKRGQEYTEQDMRKWLSARAMRSGEFTIVPQKRTERSRNTAMFGMFDVAATTQEAW